MASTSVVVLKDVGGPTGPLDLTQVTVETVFDINSGVGETAVQLGDCAKNLLGRLQSLQPEAVVVRRADLSAKARNTEGPRFRLLMEGALTGAAQQIVPNTVIRNGKDCGTAYGSSKADLDGDAESVKGGKYKEAAAAALSELAAHRARAASNS